MKRKLMLVFTAFVAMVTFGALSPTSAQASIGYTTHSCTAGSGTKFTVTSWFDDYYTRKTYHYAAVAKGYYSSWSVSYSTRTVYWNGISLLDDGSSLKIEGYRSSSYLQATPWKASFQRYNFGVPTGTTSCSFYA